MPGYGKTFSSLWEGSLRGDSVAQLVFIYMFSNCDASGIFDVHPRAIADATGLSLNVVWKAVRRLELNDDQSRSPEMNGRRIVRIDEHREWGWQVVNYEKYRQQRSLWDRRDYHRRYWRDHRSTVISAPPQPHSDSIRFPTSDPNVKVDVDRDSIREWGAAYPSVDVPAKVQHLRQWLIENPAKRKAPGTTRAWIVNRLAEDQAKAPKIPKEPTRDELRRAERDLKARRARELEERREPVAEVDPEALRKLTEALAAAKSMEVKP